MDHLVVQIVFLLACVCVGVYMWTTVAKARTRVCVYVCVCMRGLWVCDCMGMFVHTQDAYCQAWGQRDACSLSFASPSDTLEPVLSSSFLTKGSSQGHWWF